MTDTLGNTPGGTYQPATPITTSPATTSPAPSSTRDEASQEARDVAQDAAAGAKQTAETARQQAEDVAGEAMTQARALLDQTKEQLSEQGSAQQEKAVGGLHSLADELTELVNGGGSQNGLAADLARQASDRIRSTASWLESRQPTEVLDDVRRFARKRPGTFLLSAAAVGFLGARLTRGVTDASSDNTSGTAARTAPPASVAPVVPAVPVVPAATQQIGHTGITHAPGESVGDSQSGTGTGFPVENTQAPLR